MTEAEWLALPDVGARYGALHPRWAADGNTGLAQSRKSRLLWAACARTQYARLPWLHRLMVDYAERMVDGFAAERSDLRTALISGEEEIGYCEYGTMRQAAIERLEAHLRVEFGLHPAGDEPALDSTGELGCEAITWACRAIWHMPPRGSCLQDSEPTVAYFRDIFGNPFDPVAFSPEWRSSTAVALAAQMYESRDFSAIPILADALQDAGCDSADVLSHCRDAGAPHVRGCWVVDLVLGKP